MIQNVICNGTKTSPELFMDDDEMSTPFDLTSLVHSEDLFNGIIWSVWTVTRVPQSPARGFVFVTNRGRSALLLHDIMRRCWTKQL